jgi:hypothetical protein
LTKPIGGGDGVMMGKSSSGLVFYRLSMLGVSVFFWASVARSEELFLSCYVKSEIAFSDWNFVSSTTKTLEEKFFYQIRSSGSQAAEIVFETDNEGREKVFRQENDKWGHPDVLNTVTVSNTLIFAISSQSLTLDGRSYINTQVNINRFNGNLKRTSDHNTNKERTYKTSIGSCSREAKKF